MGYYTDSHLPMVYDTACLGARNPGHYSLSAPRSRIGSLAANALLVVTPCRGERSTDLVYVVQLVEYHDVILVLHFDDGEHTPF